LLVDKITRWGIKYSALLVLGGGLSVVNNIAFGQVYWIMTVCILFAIHLYQKNRPVAAGWLLGIFSALKYFPVVFIAGYFLHGLFKRPLSRRFAFSGEFKLVASAMIILCALIVLQYVFFGPAVMHEFLTNAFIPHLDGHLAGQGPYSYQFQSWDNFFRNVFIENAEFNPDPLFNWPYGKTIFKVAVMLIASGLMVLTLHRYRHAETDARKTVFLSLPALTALVILPVSATYHFALLIVPLSLLLGDTLLKKKIIIMILMLYGMIGFIPYGLAFRMADSWGLFFAYPRLWIISALYIMVITGLLQRSLPSKE
jgi:hypothetical protein